MVALENSFIIPSCSDQLRDFPSWFWCKYLAHIIDAAFVKVHPSPYKLNSVQYFCFYCFMQQRAWCYFWRSHIYLNVRNITFNHNEVHFWQEVQNSPCTVVYLFKQTNGSLTFVRLKNREKAKICFSILFVAQCGTIYM